MSQGTGRVRSEVLRREGTPAHQNRQEEEEQEEREEEQQEDDLDAQSVASEANSRKSAPRYQVMSAPTLTPPGPFDFSKPAEWPDYSTRFARYIRLSHLREADEDTKIDTLLYEMGKAADQALRTFHPQPRTFDQTLEAFNKYFNPKNNVIFKRTMFNNRNQGEHESSENFIRSVYELAEECHYGDMKDELIRDRLIAGMQDQQLSRELQLDDSVTLHKVCSKLRQKEQLRQESHMLQKAAPRSPAGESSNVDAVRKSKKPWQKTWYGPQNSDPEPASTKFQPPQQGQAPPFKQRVHRCRRCGQIPGHRLQNCPARNDRCTFCNKMGHFSKLCYHAEPNDLREVKIQSQNEEEDPMECQPYILGLVQEMPAASKVAAPKFAGRNESPQSYWDRAGKDPFKYNWRHQKAPQVSLQQSMQSNINIVKPQNQVFYKAPRPRSNSGFVERGSSHHYKHQHVDKNSPTTSAWSPRRGDGMSGQCPLVPRLNSASVWPLRNCHLNKKETTKYQGPPSNNVLKVK